MSEASIHTLLRFCYGFLRDLQSWVVVKNEKFLSSLTENYVASCKSNWLLMIHEKLKVSILFPWRPNLLTHIIIKKHRKKPFFWSPCIALRDNKRFSFIFHNFLFLITKVRNWFMSINEKIEQKIMDKNILFV